MGTGVSVGAAAPPQASANNIIKASKPDITDRLSRIYLTSTNVNKTLLFLSLMELGVNENAATHQGPAVHSPASSPNTANPAQTNPARCLHLDRETSGQPLYA